jgi:hypothetical protein
MPKIEPHLALSLITPDTVAECWEGVLDADLYGPLWDCVPKYDNSYRENIEDIGPMDVVGINAVSEFWDSFTPEQQAKLNQLAVRNLGEDEE